MSEETSNIAKQLGSLGGKKTLKKHGTKHFSELAKKRWDKKRAEDKSTKPNK